MYNTFKRTGCVQYKFNIFSTFGLQIILLLASMAHVTEPMMYSTCTYVKIILCVIILDTKAPKGSVTAQSIQEASVAYDIEIFSTSNILP